RPTNLFVAGFIGSPKMNLLQAEFLKATQGQAHVRLKGGEVVSAQCDASQARPGDEVVLGVRPEHLVLDNSGETLAAEVVFVETLGAVVTAHLRHPASSETITVNAPGDTRLEAGQKVMLRLTPGRTHLFDSAGKAFPAA
ncbi:hypothetical protein LTR94_028373, partial [Friedmanniomyces endolithicus]